MIHIFTITARNYLAIALTLGDSISKFHPEAKFTICVADGIEGLGDVLKNPNHTLLDVPKIFDKAEINDLAFKYNITEYCTSVKPAIFRHIFDTEKEVDLVYYMDPDTCLFSRLDPITAGTPEKTLYLAPHLIDCRIADSHGYPEYRHLWEGIFNLGFCAIRRTQRSTEIIDWWDARLREYCYADHLDGLHTDQKWMDYAPVFFGDTLEIVRHKGVNVAHWNISERPIEIVAGQHYAGEQPLIFFHFSGFDFKGDMLTKHSPVETQRQYLTQTLTDMSKAYRDNVKRNGFDRFITIPYAFGTFEDGTPITQPIRRLYRVSSKERSFVTPFSSTSDFYQAAANAGLLDRSSAARSNYTKATVTNLDAKLDRIASLLRFALKTIGFRRYAQLVKLAGYLGRFENHVFLLGKKREA